MENRFAEKLVKEYSSNEPTKLDELKALDRKAKHPAKVFAYIFGTIGSLVLGTGMCLSMKIIGNSTSLMIVGVVVGLLGIFMVSLNYAIYKNILNKRKKKYSEEILAKSYELLNQ